MLTDLMTATAGAHKLRPALIGPTGCGKTARVHEAAKALGLPVFSLRLQNKLPEDLGFLPSTGSGRTYHLRAPEWAVKLHDRPHVLFLDELDKAHPSTLGCLLTLIWELELEGLQFHQDTILVAGLQPVDVDWWLASETTRALSSRFFFVPVGYDRRRILDRHGIDLTDFPSGDPVQLPVLPVPSDRQLEQLILLRHAMPEEAWHIAVKGSLPPLLAEAFIERVKAADKRALTPKSICDALLEGKLSPHDLELPEVIQVAGSLFVSDHPSAPNILGWLLVDWFPKVTTEDRSAILKTMHQYCFPNGEQVGEALKCLDNHQGRRWLTAVTWLVAENALGRPIDQYRDMDLVELGHRILVKAGIEEGV